MVQIDIAALSIVVHIVKDKELPAFRYQLILVPVWTRKQLNLSWVFLLRPPSLGKHWETSVKGEYLANAWPDTPIRQGVNCRKLILA